MVSTGQLARVIYQGMVNIVHTIVGLSTMLTFIGAIIACLGILWIPLAIVGGILAAIGSIWSAIEQNALDEEIKQKNEFIINYLTGSDSYCYLEPSSQSLEEDSTDPDYAIVHRGEYPLYDASMIVTDLDEMKIRKQRGPLSTKDIEQVPLGTLPPHQIIYNHGELFLGKEATRRSYNIQFMARNGCWFQNMRFARVDERWCYAIRVTTFQNNKELFMHVSGEYPRNNKGDVEW